MARIRSVKPEYWADEDMAALVRDARLLYIGLWNIADEHGRLRGDPRWIKGQLFAYDDDLDAHEVDVLLDSLAKAGKLVRYRVDGRRYAFLPKLATHQRLEPEKVPSKLPDPADADPDIAPDQPTQFRADESARNSDESTPREEDHALLYVAGSMEHGACIPREPAVRVGTQTNERDDVELICRHLADRIEANGSKRPAITAKWRTEARLLIDRDARPVDKILKAIDWCQDDQFWKANILSMPTFRDKYDKLRLAAQRNGVTRAGPNNTTTGSAYTNPPASEYTDQIPGWEEDQ